MTTYLPVKSDLYFVLDQFTRPQSAEGACPTGCFQTKEASQDLTASRFDRAALLLDTSAATLNQNYE